MDEYSDNATESWGRYADIDGLFVDQPRRQPERITLVGCAPLGVLRDTVGTALPVRIGDIAIFALEVTSMGWALDDVTVLGSRPNDVDPTLVGGHRGRDRRGRAAAPGRAADLGHVAAGRPQRKNLWARYDHAIRREWLRAAVAPPRAGRLDADPGQTFHLDGRFVTNKYGFYCAMGEAVNGPGGYFGWCSQGFTECLQGHWGARPPFTVVWHDSDVAQTYISDSFEMFVEILREYAQLELA